MKLCVKGITKYIAKADYAGIVQKSLTYKNSLPLHIAYMVFTYLSLGTH